jgi:hypothetical protein
MAFPKRRRDGEFHKMFPSIPEDEILIRGKLYVKVLYACVCGHLYAFSLLDYSCAWNKDILHHGRIYLSLNWLCFKDGLFNADVSWFVMWYPILRSVDTRSVCL